MYPCSTFERLPALREGARRAILWVLWLAPSATGGLAAHQGMGWELVTLLGIVVAVGASMGCHPVVPGARGRLLLGVGLALATGLVLGAGRGVLPAGLAAVLPVAALVLAGGLCDGRALLAALALLAMACLLPACLLPVGVVPVGVAGAMALVQAAMLFVLAGAILAAQRLGRRAAGAAVVLAPPRRGPARPVWTRPDQPAGPPAWLVQAERAPDGTLRLALAGRDGACLPARFRITNS